MLHSADSAANPTRPMAAGDLVVVYEGFDNMKSTRIVAGGMFQNRFGGFPHNDWIGRPFGSKAMSKKGNGWILLLAPTPELWTNVLRHRTQILYAADIAMVVALLELRPGAVVLETGTGSGSLTHSLARTVAPTGHVYTFEYHEQRAALAAEEFKANGIGHLVTVTHRDIELGGFSEEHHGKADAVFLDLPKPHLVVPSAARCVRPDGMFCSFSPCIEQVQRTCEALNANGFRDMRTLEVLLRQLEVSRQPLVTDMEAPPQHKQQQGGRKKQQRRQGGGDAAVVGGDAKRQKGADGSAAAVAPGGDVPSAEGEAPAAAIGNVLSAQEEAPTAAVNGSKPAPEQQQRQQVERQTVSKPVPFGRGHTGYLTFARRVVALA
ncbi:tRNA (adenine(58)-N(1))-methyltransferase catalytic subunit 61A [Chlorella vulgaris]